MVHFATLQPLCHLTTLRHCYLITGTEAPSTSPEGVSITQEQDTISISTRSGLQVTFPSQSDTLFSNVSLVLCAVS